MCCHMALLTQIWGLSHHIPLAPLRKGVGVGGEGGGGISMYEMHDRHLSSENTTNFKTISHTGSQGFLWSFSALDKSKS